VEADLPPFATRPSNSNSQGYDRPVPVCAHAAQQRRVNDQFSELVDCRHVEGRQPADAADIDREVKAVAIRGFNQCAQRRRVDRPVDQFDEFFVSRTDRRRETAHLAPREGPLARAIAPDGHR